MIYFAILILLLIGVLFENSLPKSKKGDLYFWLCYFAIVIMFGLRYRVGGDTLNYIIKYEFIPPLSELSFLDLFLLQIEPGFAILMAFFKQYTNGFYGIQLVEAAFVNYVWFRLINKNVTHRFLGITLYYVMFSFYFTTEIMREAIAVSLFVIAYEQLLNKKTLRFYTILLIAVLFHYSCLFMFFIPLLRKYVINSKRVVILMVLLILLSFLIEPLFQYLGGYLLTKVENNTDYSFTIYGIASSILKTILFPWIVGYLYKTNVNSNPHSEEQRIIFMYIVVGSLAIGNFSILMRLTNYLQPFFLIVLVLVLERISFLKTIKPISTFVVYTFIWIFYLNPYFKDESETYKGARYYCLWYPYHSIFDERENSIRENFVSIHFEK